MAAIWKKRRPDRLTRLARAIEAIGEQDRRLIDESTRVDRLRTQGAIDLHAICRKFVSALNGKLSEPAVLLDPAEYMGGNYRDGHKNLFQINLRGRLLQIEFETTEELHSTEDFQRPYILRGAVRSFNQELLDRNTVDEQAIFYCPREDAAYWYYFDSRTYRSGRVGEDFLTAEMERLL